ncbi:MAG: short-chain dehydrogenase [Naasia sp.]|uniref:SDR family NAD(P)-dependent oxidoreductase n=1 Tax=Naasia sp. TaxID=2546198 RepID=UPI0026241507|nr:SDR family NAD(P)-dependent oxidoreductase [Naasia sp.]MCU1569546.1 short-chain dehydrogenase [Naasia sp.]
MTPLGYPGEIAGRTVVITGASSGIGAAAARALAALGAELAVVGRNPERTQAVADSVRGTAFVADFGRLDDVRRLGEQLLERYPRIHVLANNAGGMQPKRSYTVDRNERTLQETYLAAFELTRVLLPRLTDTAADAPEGSVRIIQTASAANLGGRLRLDDLDFGKGPWFGGWPAYCAVKLANILHTRELAHRLVNTGVSAYAFHPGLVRTRFANDSLSIRVASALSGGSYGISAEQGAEPLIRLASTPDVGAASGTYFSRLQPHGATTAQADDAVFARRLWSASEVRVDPARVS